MINLSNEEVLQIEKSVYNNLNISEDLYHKLYEHYLNSGEMKIGIAKARTSDPVEWVYKHMEEFI